jgi:hypothetical protein
MIGYLSLLVAASVALGPPGISGGCLASGDGYLRARVAGALEAVVDWPNSGTLCEGEERPGHGGIRLSFRRRAGIDPDLLFVFGIDAVREGQSVHGAGVNLTLIVQGASRVFGTQGTRRCTIDSLTQSRLPGPPVNPSGGRAYRVEARGFCTQPAHAVRGEGAVLVSTFDFAGIVRFENEERSK